MAHSLYAQLHPCTCILQVCSPSCGNFLHSCPGEDLGGGKGKRDKPKQAAASGGDGKGKQKKAPKEVKSQPTPAAPAPAPAGDKGQKHKTRCVSVYSRL